MWPTMIAWLFAILATIEGVRASALLVQGIARHSQNNKEYGLYLLVNTTGLAIAAILIFLVLHI